MVLEHILQSLMLHLAGFTVTMQQTTQLPEVASLELDAILAEQRQVQKTEPYTEPVVNGHEPLAVRQKQVWLVLLTRTTTKHSQLYGTETVVTLRHHVLILGNHITQLLNVFMQQEQMEQTLGTTVWGSLDGSGTVQIQDVALRRVAILVMA
jgi:hypothetical protein